MLPISRCIIPAERETACYRNVPCRSACKFDDCRRTPSSWPIPATSVCFSLRQDYRLLTALCRQLGRPTSNAFRYTGRNQDTLLFPAYFFIIRILLFFPGYFRHFSYKLLSPSARMYQNTQTTQGFDSISISVLLEDQNSASSVCRRVIFRHKTGSLYRADIHR